MKCFNCNKENDDTAKFCRYCGVNFGKKSMDENEKKRIIDLIKQKNTISVDSIDFLFETDERRKTILEYLVEYSPRSLDNLGEDLLLKKHLGKTVFEYLIEKNFLFNKREVSKSFKDPTFANILYKKGLYNELYLCDMVSLLAQANLNDTYLDIFINNRKKNGGGVNLNCKEITDNKALAKMIMIFYKNKMETGIWYLDTSRLMNSDENEVRLIDELIRINEKLTTEKIITKKEYEDLDLYRHLIHLGVNVSKYNLVQDKEFASRFYVEKMFEKKKNIEIDSKYEILLNQFKNIMLSDLRSDKEAIEKVVTSYRELISINDEYASEVEMLISIKEKTPVFGIKRTYEEKSSYKGKLKCVCLTDTANSATINHEIGHALHDLLADYEVLSEYENIASKIRKNPLTKIKILSFSSNASFIYGICRKKATEEYSNFEKTSTSNEMKEYEKSNLEGTIEWIRENSEELGYSKSEIQTILKKMPTFDEIQSSKKKAAIASLSFNILKNNYPEISAISDIIDAIYMGDYYDGLIGLGGHGSEYYKSRGTKGCFKEIIAQYSTIMRSKDPKRGIELLRSAIGDEFVDSLSEFYDKKIKGSNKYTNNEEASKSL